MRLQELTTHVDFVRNSSTGVASSDMSQLLKPSAVAVVPGTVLSTTTDIKGKLHGAFGLSDASITKKTGHQSFPTSLLDEVS